MANDMEKNVPEMEDNIIELTDEDGVATKFEYLTTIEHNDNLYVVLMVLEDEADEANEDEGEVLILEIAKDENGEDVYVIGGASVYKQLLPYCNEVYVTKVNADGGAEVFFPNLDEDKNFVCVKEGEPEEDNGLEIRFCTYKNLAPLPL